MADRFTGAMDPARNLFTITPDDEADIVPRPKALWVNGACTLVVMGENGEVGTIVMSGPGPIPFVPRRLMTASALPTPDIVQGLWG